MIINNNLSRSDQARCKIWNSKLEDQEIKIMKTRDRRSKESKWSPNKMIGMTDFTFKKENIVTLLKYLHSDRYAPNVNIIFSSCCN